MTVISTLMSKLIDYAGLFPPAQLSMKEAVENYAAYRASEHSSMLGRFICPVSRFDEFERELEALGDHFVGPWEISALPGADRAESLHQIAALEQRFDGELRVPTIEMKIQSSSDVDDLLTDESLLSEDAVVYFEVPLKVDFRGMITAIAGTGHGAKIRTGGVTPNLVPNIDTVANFISVCHQANVPFKATAGLHHPFRNHDSTVGTMMHGFLNVFGSAIMCRIHDLEASQVGEILAIDKSSGFEFGDDSLRIGDWSVSCDEIRDAREQFARSYGSCSFDEPIADLRELELLP